MHKEIQIIAFLKIFQEWNQKMNLVGDKNPKEMMVKHVQDSLALLEFFEIESGQRVLDIGSGGGFPGIPLAIICPKAQFVLVDSVGKKMNAVKEIAKEIGLKNIQTVVERAEVLGHDSEYRERFGLVVARAVAPLQTLLEYAAPFLCIHGIFVAYKSAEYKKELAEAKNAIQQLGLQFEGDLHYELPEEMGSRTLLVFRKEKELHAKYPRKPGVPKKRPL